MSGISHTSGSVARCMYPSCWTALVRLRPSRGIAVPFAGKEMQWGWAGEARGRKWAELDEDEHVQPIQSSTPKEPRLRAP